MCEPGAIVTGVTGPEVIVNDGLPAERENELTFSGSEPTLNSEHCLVVDVPTSTRPKPRSQWTASSGPVAVVSSNALRPYVPTRSSDGVTDESICSEVAL